MRLLVKSLHHLQAVEVYRTKQECNRVLVLSPSILHVCCDLYENTVETVGRQLFKFYGQSLEIFFIGR